MLGQLLWLGSNIELVENSTKRVSIGGFSDKFVHATGLAGTDSFVVRVRGVRADGDSSFCTSVFVFFYVSNRFCCFCSAH